MMVCRRFRIQRESRRSCRRSYSLHRRTKWFTEGWFDIVTNTGPEVVSEDVVGALTEQRRWFRWNLSLLWFETDSTLTKCAGPVLLPCSERSAYSSIRLPSIWLVTHTPSRIRLPKWLRTHRFRMEQDQHVQNWTMESSPKARNDVRRRHCQWKPKRGDARENDWLNWKMSSRLIQSTYK